MKTSSFTEFQAAGKEQEFLDLKKVREKYKIDPQNQIQPRDELILAGSLDITIEGVLKDPRSRMEVVVKVPATRPGETAYAYGDARSLSLGEKGTWEKVPVGEVIVEIKKTWYAPKKVRGRMKKADLVSAAKLEVPEAGVEIFSGPHPTMPRNLPPATEVIID